MGNFRVSRAANLDYFMSVLTSDTITKMSGGRIPKMTKEQASGLVGSWIVETGNPKLENLDVIEKGAAAGRGLSQYTDGARPGRRTAYEIKRAEAIKKGVDPNSPQFQLRHFVDEYAGKLDKLVGGNSLIGWTRVFERAPKSGTPGQFAQYYTGSAASGQGYFRPSVPHTDRRMDAANQVYNIYKNVNLSQPGSTVFQPETTPRQFVQNILNLNPNVGANPWAMK